MAKNKTQTTTSTKKERENTGKRGARKMPHLSGAELIRMGKGVFKSLEPVKGPAWLGATSFKEPFDEVQAKKNREAGY